MPRCWTVLLQTFPIRVVEIGASARAGTIRVVERASIVSNFFIFELLGLVVVGINRVKMGVLADLFLALFPLRLGTLRSHTFFVLRSGDSRATQCSLKPQLGLIRSELIALICHASKTLGTAAS